MSLTSAETQVLMLYFFMVVGTKLDGGIWGLEFEFGIWGLGLGCISTY